MKNDSNRVPVSSGTKIMNHPHEGPEWIFYLDRILGYTELAKTLGYGNAVGYEEGVRQFDPLGTGFENGLRKTTECMRNRHKVFASNDFELLIVQNQMRYLMKDTADDKVIITVSSFEDIVDDEAVLARKGRLTRELASMQGQLLESQLDLFSTQKSDGRQYWYVIGQMRDYSQSEPTWNFFLMYPSKGGLSNDGCRLRFETIKHLGTYGGGNNDDEGFYQGPSI